MSTSTTISSARSERGLRGAWNRLADFLSRAISDSLLALAARFAVAGIFFQSGRTKVEGWLTLTDGAYALFRDEYKVPLSHPRSPRISRPTPSICSRCCWHSACARAFRRSRCSA